MLILETALLCLPRNCLSLFFGLEIPALYISWPLWFTRLFWWSLSFKSFLKWDARDVNFSRHFVFENIFTQLTTHHLAQCGIWSWKLFHCRILKASVVFYLQFSSVAQLCPTLCDPMDCSTPGFHVHHQLLEPTQTHVHWVGDAIQPSHPLSSPSPPTFNLSQHQGLFQWVSFFA